MNLLTNITLDTKLRPPAEALESFCASIRASLEAPQLSSAQVALLTNLNNDTFQISPADDIETLPELVTAARDRLTGDPFETISKITATVTASHNKKITAILALHESRSAYTLTVSDINSSRQHGSVLEALRERFEAYTVEHARFDGLPDELRQLHLAQEQVFASREAELLAGHRELNAAIRDARKDAETQLEEERTTLHEREQQREEAYNARLADLDARDETIRREKAELDDSARMHARRKNQEGFKEVLERHREFKVSDKTAGKRWPVHIASILGMLVAITLYCYAVLRASGPDLYTIGPATLLFGSTLTFYLLWLKRWSDSHATAETNARTFEEDFSRAYWLAELMFEWAELPGAKELPPEVVEALSRGLFTVQRDGAPKDEHPVANLISRIPNLRKVSVDRRSLSVEASPGGEP